MASLDTPFWRNVEAFRAMGLDPLRWIAGCSVKVDDELVMLPAMASARAALERMGVTVGPREGPAILDYRGNPLKIDRVVVDPDGTPEPRPAKRANPRWASALGRVERRMGDDPEALAQGLVAAFAGVPAAAAARGLGGDFDRPVVVGSLEAHATAPPGSQFVAFDFLDPGRGPVSGRFAVKGEALEVTDATLDPYDPTHAQGALAAALAPLAALGCWRGLRAWPVLDAPTPEGRASLAASFGQACARAGVRVEETVGPDTGSLFIGATVAGVIDHDPPGRHQDVAAGMEVALTRPFGDLAPLLVRLMARSEEDLERRAERAGFPMSELDRLAEGSREALTRPDLAAARAIADHRPAYGEVFDPADHVAATVDLSLSGAVGLARFAKRRSLSMRLDDLPLAHAPLSRFATAEFLTDNATACAPGALAVVATPSAVDAVDAALRTGGSRALRIGSVTDGWRGVVAPPIDVRRVVGAKRLREGFAAR